MDLSQFQLQFYRVYVPGSLDSENAPIQFVVLHPRNCRTPTSETLAAPLQTLNSQKTDEVRICQSVSTAPDEKEGVLEP